MLVYVATVSQFLIDRKILLSENDAKFCMQTKYIVPLSLVY